MDFSSNPRKRRLSAPQNQAQLSRLSDRTRLRRLNTLFSRGAWQEATRIEDLCHTHVSHKWLYHLAHDYITNVQKRLGNRAWTGFANAVCVDHPRTPNLNTEKPAAPPKPLRGTTHAFTPSWCGLKLADPGITTEPRGLTATQSSPVDLFTAAAVPGRSAALDVCVASPNAAAARGEAAFDRKLSDYWHEIPDLRTQGILYCLLVFDSRRATTPSRNSNTPLHSRCRIQPQRPTGVGKIASAQMETRNQIALFRRMSAMTRAVAPRQSQRRSSQSLGPSHLFTEETTMTTAKTQGQTRPYQTTMTTTISTPSPVNRLCLCSHQVSRCARLLPRGHFVCFVLMFADDLGLELDALFEDQGAPWTVIGEAVCHRWFAAQLPLSYRQMFNRQQCAHLLRDFGAAAALPL